MWVRKYKPRKLAEVVNQKKAVRKILNWFNNWKPGNKALMLHGPAGTGKTCTIEALANERNYDFIEMNASNYRSAKQIREVFGLSAKQKSLFKHGKIFTIDEVDGLSGRQDRGGVGEIIKIVKGSQHPVILTANHPYDKKLRRLRKGYCKLVKFKKIPFWSTVKRLERICKSEGVKADRAVLKKIAKGAEGDLRSAINDLESVASGKSSIEMKDLKSLGYRERESNIFEVLREVFKASNALEAKRAIRSCDKDPKEIFWWIENNIHREYKEPEEIAKAFDALSRADIFKRRIRKRQNWRYLVYFIDLMTAGVAIAKKRMYRKFTRYRYPSNIRILGQTKGRRRKERERLEELSRKLHCSTEKVRSEFLSFLRIFAGEDLSI